MRFVEKCRDFGRSQFTVINLDFVDAAGEAIAGVGLPAAHA